MIISMEENVSTRVIESVVDRVKSMGFSYQLNVGTERVVIAVLGGDTHKTDVQVFQVLPGVAEVQRIQKQYKLSSIGFKKEKTIINVGKGIKIGGSEKVLIAGPCSIESEDQIMQCARIAKKVGVQMLRGGAFKPRTSPYSFQGLGKKGLEMLNKAGQEYDLAVTTEVVAIEDIEMVAQYVDVLQIGARNMQNYELLRAVSKINKPVILKRGLSAGIEDEWLPAADYILNGGKAEVILCERGIKTFEKSTRYTLDVSSIAVVKENSHLPIIVDPSHAAGHFKYVPYLSRAAISAGADGLIMEIHPAPWRALSDGAQSLTFSDFQRLISEIK